jgi:hypothetical protein
LLIRVRGGHYAGAETAFLKGFAIYETAVDTVRCASAWTSIPCCPSACKHPIVCASMLLRRLPRFTHRSQR